VGDDVHVWRASLEASASARSRFEATLSGDELDRANRFHFERDRRRFIVARGVLRILLGEYLRTVPQALTFEYGSHGKPALADRHRGTITFNVSHSGELALFAFSRRGDIGIDIEAIRPMPDGDNIAARFFSAREVARFQALPHEAREEAFFRCWTRKEAYVKAVGDGLARALDAFDVTFAPGEPVRLTVEGDERESRRWTLRPLDPPDGYTAALVTEGRRRVSCWGWTDNRIPLYYGAKEAV
jgi:4'-phosphopantetheinyl transferase